MKVYVINDCDWYIARSLYEAVIAAMKDTGLPFEEACDNGLGEVSPDAMQHLVYIDEERNPEPQPPVDSLVDQGWPPLIKVQRTFAQQLDLEVARDPKTARMFASTEM